MFNGTLHGIRRNGLVVEKSSLTGKQLNTLREQLSYHRVDFMTQEQTDPIQFYTETTTEMNIPKFFHSDKIPSICTQDVTQIVPMATPALQYTGKLYETPERPQQTVFDRAVQTLHNAKTPGCVITLPCGTGKTNIAIAIALHLRSRTENFGSKTAILCHTGFLMRQWQDRLQEFCSSPPKIGIIKQNVCDTLDKDFVICSIQSIASRNYDPECLKFGTLIVDEAHHISAPVFSGALIKMTYHFSIGLTATPKRRDGLQHIIYWHLGACCFNFRRPKNSQIAVKMITYPNGRQVEIRYKNGVIGIPRMINMLISDDVRNNHIIKIVHEIYRRWPNRRGLLLSDRVSHLKMLHRAIGRDMSSVITGSYNSEVSATQRGRRKHGVTETVSDRKRIRDAEIKESYQFKRFITLSTYHLFSEAVDFTGDFIILATPRSRVEQAIGRVTRGHEGNQTALIIDIVDPYSLFENMKWMRYNLYKKFGYLVKFTCTETESYACHDWLTRSPICITTTVRDQHGVICNNIVADDGDAIYGGCEEAGGEDQADYEDEFEEVKLSTAERISGAAETDNSGEEDDCNVQRGAFVTTIDKRNIVSYFSGLPSNRLVRTPRAATEFFMDKESTVSIRLTHDDKISKKQKT
jgi:superfamily II DNA or RNA helicase